MDENELMTENEYDDQNEVSVEDIEAASWVPTLLVGGAGMIVGIAVHKFVVPTAKKVVSSAKKKLIEFLTENDNGSIEIEAQIEEEDSNN